jgi:uncharacterized protein YyaL (SSP411 family)
MRVLRLICLSCLLAALIPSALALENQLANNPSPYLALHGQDPTAWQEWNEQTVQRARKENKLLFVSIGYFSCHWCHVMQRESYKNPEIAAMLNEHFIPVKVDRELASALDSEMQNFAAETRGQSGWPINVFVTPEGYPLFATLYSPPREFLGIISRMAERWSSDGANLKRLAQQAAPRPPIREKSPEPKFAPAIGEHYRKQLVAEALAQADTFRGGFGSANKFPMAPQLLALMDAYARDPQEQLGRFLRVTLDQMAGQGLYDHVGGGFFRYTVDPDWQVPHFEKMLYDNAQLALLYLRGAEVFDQPAYRQIAFSSLDFVLRDLRDPVTSALMTSTSAVDEQNREGAAYLWDKRELQRLLPADDYGLVSRIWGLEQPAELEFGYLPLNHSAPTFSERQRLEGIYATLLKQRLARTLPRDDKLLASLNGLALMALSTAAKVEPRYFPAARGVRDFLVNQMWVGTRLAKARSKGRIIGDGELEDYAYVAAGMLAFAGLPGQEGDLELVRKIATQGWEKFYLDPGWKLQKTTLLASQANDVIVPDGATFSPSALLIQTSWSLGGKSLRTKALSGLNVGYAEMDRGAFWYASQVSAMGKLQAGR